eukprot:CAMPEP_0201692336 /NCGR_PEP_ID=MMETSP0578-20130828/5258_1 /ASSEMBLY_ACC=CAM_ASM_000663 /TAXON_ID=267565 /ORGANISM="Skeletonema grethea, Strain CCMP 1804" /LENGTH=574 /DNA_ID=CAMNT_0048177695 /DNA_START=110 /DNA_END=1834 /DNA_ORIENTATION=+
MSAAAVTSRETDCAVGVAAGLTFLGIGFACANERSVNCDQTHNEMAQGESDSSFRTLSASEIKAAGCDMNKSERAFAFATANGLFNAYEDGADNYVYESDADDEEAVQAGNSSGDCPATNAVVEKFVSFSPANAVNIQPRMSIRHTNRKASKQESLLATSRWKETFPDKADDTRTDEEKKDVIVKRINSVQRNGLGQNQVYTQQMYFYQAAQVKDYLRDRFRLFALPSSESLGKEMALLLDTSLNAINVGAFTDGETSVKVEDRVRGKDVFLVCSTTSTDAVMELLLTVSAIQRSSAKRLCVVIPYYGYSRQDRRTMDKREPIAAADIAKMLEEMGVDSVICVDLHNPLVKGFFSPIVPVDHLMPGPVAAAYFYEELFTGMKEDPNEVTGMDKSEEPKEDPKITIVAAHENQVFRANGFRSALQKLSGSSDIRVALVTTSTEVNVHNKTKTSTIVGDVEGRKCIIVDDIINTGSTLKGAIEAVHKSGASEVYAWATHGVFHNPENNAPEMFQELEGLKYMLISNSVTNNRDLPPKIRTLSIAPLLSEAVVRSLHSESIMSMLDVNKPKSRTWSK